MVMKRPMVVFLTRCYLPSGRGWCRARLEAENLLLRQQLVVLRRKSPRRLRLRNVDRLLFMVAEYHCPLATFALGFARLTAFDGAGALFVLGRARTTF